MYDTIPSWPNVPISPESCSNDLKEASAFSITLAASLCESLLRYWEYSLFALSTFSPIVLDSVGTLKWLPTCALAALRNVAYSMVDKSLFVSLSISLLNILA